MNPQLALSITADKHFMFAMASETEENKIEEKVENRLVDLTTQLQLQKQALEKDVYGKDEELKNRNDEIIKLAQKIDAMERVVEEGRTSGQRKAEDLGRSLEEEKARSVAAKQEAKKIQAEFKAYKASVVRWALFVGGLGLTSVILWLHQYWLYWPWLDTHKNRTILELTSQLLLVFTFLNIPLKQHWKIWVPITVAIALAIFASAIA